MKIIELDSVDSTNEYLKRMDFAEDTIVTAKMQTAGRGTKGRSFISDEGGLYVSVMRRYSDFNSTEAFKIMINSCVAVCRTAERFGVKPIIRWANDVLVRGKKICGTLIENTFSGNNVSRSIVGMGLNVNNLLPAELEGIATTLSAELQRPLNLAQVRDTLISNLRKSFTINDYKSYINWFGREITVTANGGVHSATAVDVDNDGSLICIMEGSLKKVRSAEVSIRL